MEIVSYVIMGGGGNSMFSKLNYDKLGFEIVCEIRARLIH